METIFAAGMEVNPFVKDGDIVSLVVACVAPMNLIKGGFASIITMLIYKPLSPILKASQRTGK